VLTAAAASIVGASALWLGRVARLRRGFADHLRNTAPEIAVTAQGPLGITAEVLGVPIRVDLVSLQRRRPRGLSDAAWFARVRDELRAQLPAPAVPPLALVQDRVLPLLRPTAYVRLFDHYGPAHRPAWRPLDADVAITYVISGLHMTTTVTDAAQALWGLAPDRLHRLAVTNLRAGTAHMLSELGAARRTYEHIDGFDASRLLIADMVIPHEVARPLVAIPEESVLLIAPADDREALAATAAARCAPAARPLTATLYRYEAGRPVPA
jgi:hypothetical protein